MTLPQRQTRRSLHALVKLVVVALLLGAAIGGGIFLALPLLWHALWGEGPAMFLPD
ncbi:hypothetical protein [Microbispora siamensis]|uniref:Uncharacterized protein n=1 Tax=Microbispora siamensis TaxID=564413 RepID=A0ABQ4GH37_9ACTN|nr:hypothetical protein [Microbispora siamensis]GIH60739.1 hypothetical protein Msi02_15560 [Microbispora siamensis]